MTDVFAQILHVLRLFRVVVIERDGRLRRFVRSIQISQNHRRFALTREEFDS